MCRGICHFLNMSMMLMSALIVGAGMALLRAVQPSRVTGGQTQVNIPRSQNQLTYFGDRGKHATPDMDMDLDADTDLDIDPDSDSDFEMDMMNEDQSLDRSQVLRESQRSNKKEIVFGHLTFLR